LGSLILLFLLGVHHRPSPDFDYSEVRAVEKDGFAEVNFDFLSGFDYEKEQIPDQIQTLDGKNISVTGFMLPVDFEEGKVTSFILLNNQMGCCFGIMPRVNEFIYVKMQGNTNTKFMTDVPIKVFGKFKVGDENVVGSLYGIEADRVLVHEFFE
jgi:hypothetical protein